MRTLCDVFNVSWSKMVLWFIDLTKIFRSIFMYKSLQVVSLQCFVSFLLFSSKNQSNLLNLDHCGNLWDRPVFTNIAKFVNTIFRNNSTIYPKFEVCIMPWNIWQGSSECCQGSWCNVHQSRSKISKIRRIPKKCANQNGRPSRSLKSKRKHTQRKKTPPDHREDRKAAKEDIQKQKLANTPVLCHQNRKIARMSRKRDEEEGAIFAWVEPKAQNSLRTVQNASPVLFYSILADFQVFVNGKTGRCWF